MLVKHQCIIHINVIIKIFFKFLYIYIYACPVILQDAKTQWSQTLWIDLDIQLLQQGIEGFIKRLRLLPKEVRAMPVAFFLDGRMKEFRESLPLLLDLKNEALRDRSVSRLILVRNQNEYNTPPKFTVNNVAGFVLLSLRFKFIAPSGLFCNTHNIDNK